jgi:ATP-binding cassette subfamily C protein CydCD
VEVYDAVVPLTPARLGRRRGDLLTSIVDDVDSVVDRELRVRMPWRSYAIVVALFTLVALLLQPAAALVVLGGGIAGGLGAWSIGRRGATTSERAAVALRADLASRVVETVQLSREQRMWQAADRCADAVVRVSNGLGAAATNAVAWTGAARAWCLVTAAATIAGVAAVTAPAVAAGTLSGPMMALLLLTPLALAEVAAPLAEAGALSARTDAAAERLDRLAHLTPAVRDTVGEVASGRHDVNVDEVRGRWDAEAPVTAECSLRLDPGDRVALVGASGSGKSTVAALLVRFLDPDSGAVRHGGQDLRDLALDDVRRATGLVDDDPHVFATTVVENIRLARPEASDDEVRGALQHAGLGDWLAALPDGLDTWLGDGHAGLSGGERARLGVARSLLADQPVLVLDEPASHLDHATATALAGELLTGARSRAVLWITHTDIGLDLVDRVVDLDLPPAEKSAAGPRSRPRRDPRP